MSLIKIAEEVANTLTNEVYDYLKENYPADCLGWVKDAKWSLKSSVPLSEIKMSRRPGGARETDKVKGIAQAVKDGKKMEPVVLVKMSDGSYKIADGYHRTLGFKHAGEEGIKAYVAKVKTDNGPWDKEMHEKKLNVGMPKKAFVGGLLNFGKRMGSGLLGVGKRNAAKELDRVNDLNKVHQQGVKQFDEGYKAYFDTAKKNDPNWRMSEGTLRMTQSNQKMQAQTNKMNDQVRSAEQNLKDKTRDQRMARGLAGVGLVGVGTQQALKDQQQKNDQKLLDNMQQQNQLVPPATPYIPKEMEPGFQQQAGRKGFGLLKIAEKKKNMMN